jgi:hypothetical protein
MLLSADIAFIAANLSHRTIPSISSIEVGGIFFAFFCGSGNKEACNFALRQWTGNPASPVDKKILNKGPLQ